MTTFPLTMWIESSWNATSSTVFHSPVGFSLSGCLMTRPGDHMLAHLRTEAYPVYARHQYPPARGGDTTRASGRREEGGDVRAPS